MFCSQCGKALPGEAKFCPYCGGEIVIDEQTSADEVIGTSETPVEEPIEEVAEVSEVSAEPETIDEASDPETIDEATEPETIDEASEPEAIDEASEPEAIDEASESEAVPAPVTETVPETAPEIKPQKQVKKYPVIGHICLTFVSILLALALIASMLVTSVRMFASEFGIKNIVSSIKVKEVTLDEFEELGIINEEEFEKYGLSEDDTVVDYVYELIDNGQYETEITRGDVEKIFDMDIVGDYLSRKSDELMEAVESKEAFTVINTEEIKEIIEDNKETIEEETGLVIKDSDIEKIENSLSSLNENIGSITIDFADSDIIETVEVAQSVLSPVFLILPWMIVLLLMVIIIVSRRSVIGSLRYCGIPFLVGGLILTIPVAAVLLGGKMIFSGLPSIIVSAIGSVTVLMLYCAIVPAVLGLAAVVAASIIKSVRKKRAAL